MGFAVYYRSTKPIHAGKRVAIEASSIELCKGRTWLSCEPVSFYFDSENHYIVGSCKPNWMPHPEDVAAAESEDLPDGTLQDAFDVLCRLSRDHGVDWEISHDESNGPIGLIRNGQPDSAVREAIEMLSNIGDEFGGYENDESYWSNEGKEEWKGGQTRF